MTLHSMSSVKLTTAEGRVFYVHSIDTIDPLLVKNGRLYVEADIEVPIMSGWPWLRTVSDDCTLAIHDWRQPGVQVKVLGFSIPAEGLCTFHVIMSWAYGEAV